MEDIVSKHVEDIAPYEGPHAIDGIRFRHAAKALGVSAWGMNVLELDAGCEDYPEHDHAHDGQEEVYVILRGSATLLVDGERHTMREGDLTRVAPRVTRKIVPGDAGVTVLAVGSTEAGPFR